MSSSASIASGSDTLARKRTSMRSRRTMAMANMTTPASAVASTRNIAPTPSTFSIAKADTPDKKPAMAMMRMSLPGTG